MNRRRFGRGLLAGLLGGLAAPTVAQPYYPPPPSRRIWWMENRPVTRFDRWGRPYEALAPIRVCGYR